MGRPPSTHCRVCAVELIRYENCYYRTGAICKDCYNLKAKDWRDANPEYVREYLLNHAEDNRARVSAWNKANPVKARAKVRKWEQKFPEKVKVLRHRKRAIRANAPGSFTEKEWLTLLETCNYQCMNPDCTTPDDPLTVEHIVPLSRGGTNYIDNIQVCCKSCNSKKYTKTIDYRNSR